MRALDLSLALVGGLTLALSLGAGLLHRRGYLVSEGILAVAFGVAIGPAGLDVLRLADWGHPLTIVEQVARLTVALAVTSIALRLPTGYVRRRAASLATLLGPGMALMWVASGLVAAWVLGLPLWAGMLVGAIVTPTDPVLASSIVQGVTAERNVPVRLRNLLSAEAGANDGAAYPFVFLALFALGHAGAGGIGDWAVSTLLRGVLGAVVLGVIVGGGVGYLERLLSDRGYLEETSVFTVTVALTFATLGLAKLLGAVDVLAVFVTGLAYNRRANPRDEAQEAQVEEVLNRLFTVPAFVIFGAAVPWAAWAALGWRGVALVAGILLLRRIPMVLTLRGALPPLDRPAATLFVGWFGPIGVAALYYATLAARETGSELPWVVGSLVVAGSILAHGATSTLFTRWYGRLGDDAAWW